MIKIYNSLTKRKEVFTPLKKGEVKMYACGITASGEAHIGHAIQALVFDIIRKYLEKRGYKVEYVRNYTDIDDKIIVNSKKVNMSVKDFAENIIKNIDKDLNDLGIDKPTYMLKATNHMGDIIDFISKLIKKGYAYQTDEGDVYFAVKEFSGYGKLSNRKLENAYTGVRVELEDNKESLEDFALWKSAKEDEPYWNSPWGRGRPGWHIECSAMNYCCLGEQIDIHGGGRDLIFPHHENEIAQTEALTGKNFAKYWVHNGLVKVNGLKMSKSLGNSLFLRDLLNAYSNEVLRFALLQTNYKNDINVTDTIFSDAEKHMFYFYKSLKSAEELGIISNVFAENIDEEFNKEMDDDFNTAKVLANLFDYFKKLNTFVLAGDKKEASKIYNAIKKTYNLLGLFKEDVGVFIRQIENKTNALVSDEIKELANMRKQARVNKDYRESDRIRDLITLKGYEIKDLSNNEYELTKK